MREALSQFDQSFGTAQRHDATTTPWHRATIRLRRDSPSGSQAVGGTRHQKLALLRAPGESAFDLLPYPTRAGLAARLRCYPPARSIRALGLVRDSLDSIAIVTEPQQQRSSARHSEQLREHTRRFWP